MIENFRELKLRSENVKRGFFNPKLLLRKIKEKGTPHPFRLESGHNTEIIHTNFKAFPSCIRIL